MWLCIGGAVLVGGIALWFVLRGIDAHIGKQIKIPEFDPRHSQADVQGLRDD
jgi:hypothetical protein